MNRERIKRPMRDRGDVIRVLLVDDHAVVRQCIRLVIERKCLCKVVGEAATVAQAVAMAKRLKPDVVLLDAHLHGENGLDACADIRRKAPGSKILVLTAFADEDLIRCAIRGGASGYVLKNIDVAALARGIRDVAEGKTVYTDTASKCLMDSLRRPARPKCGAIKERLSPQERKVMALAAEGKTNKAIAREMNLCETTVKHYLSSIMCKLQLCNRARVHDIKVGI